MATEEAPAPIVSTDEAEVETVDENEDKAADAEAAKEAARAQAEARRKRILEKANNRMKYVNGEQNVDEEEKKSRNSNAARIRAARQRRYGKKSTAASTAAATPAPAPTAETETPAATTEASQEPPATEPEKPAEAPAAVETPAATESAPAPAPATTSADPQPKKKYLGVARTRRKMLAKKKMEEEKESATSSAAESDSANASLSSKGKPAAATSAGKAVLPSKVQTVPIYMHIVIILLMFFAGFDIGVQQFHADIDVRTQFAVQEFGLPLLHRSPWQSLKPSEALEEKLSSTASASTEESQDEFEEIDEEYVPPNIDPIFRVDLDELTKGPGILNQLGRGAISIHRLIMWIFFFGPMGFLTSILAIPAAIMASPPGLFFSALILRQVVGKGIGAGIPGESVEEGGDSAKQNNIEVISMAKNFVKNFFATTFPTLVSVYDVYTHLRTDMYIVFCGAFLGIAWTHLGNDALSCDADDVVDAVVEAVGDIASAGGEILEGEL